jgi:hypothetical protein
VWINGLWINSGPSRLRRAGAAPAEPGLAGGSGRGGLAAAPGRVQAAVGRGLPGPWGTSGDRAAVVSTFQRFWFADALEGSPHVAVIFAAFDIGFDVLRWDETYSVAECGQFAGP